MPKVDPPWDKPQETQYCKSCEDLARELRAAQERNEKMNETYNPTKHFGAFAPPCPNCKAVQERLAVAEALLAKLADFPTDLSCSGGEHDIEIGKLQNEYIDFLSSQPSGLVAVRRKDLEKLKRVWEIDGRYYKDFNNICDRLIATLEAAGKEPQ